MENLQAQRSTIRQQARMDETVRISDLMAAWAPNVEVRAETTHRAVELVKTIRAQGNPGLMEAFLAEYGLSTDEGVALMCLAEALLRVPDAETIDELIEDKISPSSWGTHLGKSSSSLVNASTWALMLSGKVLSENANTGIADVLHGAVKRLGEPVIRVAVQRAMKEMGHQFVLGRTIDEAIKRGKSSQDKGYTYSYDMLGEAALTSKDATEFFHSYCDAIRSLARIANFKSTTDNPGISIKLSALHPRYEVSQKERVMNELVPRVKELAILAKNANMGLNIDAEEADRLDLSLDVIEAVLRSSELENWDGFGVVVQAYGKRASSVIDWLYALSIKYDRKIMVRLVKGAYWDTEIKVAQVDGVSDFPVYSQKSATDISYICCAKSLLAKTDRIYPQFATHNAHTVAAVLEMASDKTAFEFQRLHGMGEALHKAVLEGERTRCRIYAPVGAHRDLLAYLVRRLLENGANSSFVNQIVDPKVAPERVVADPFTKYQNDMTVDTKGIVTPPNLFQADRINSKGWDLRNLDDLTAFEDARDVFKDHTWTIVPLIDGPINPAEAKPVFNPSNLQEPLGTVAKATEKDVAAALNAASDWHETSAQQRADVLEKAADLYEKNAGEIFAALCREAGKTPLDAIAEIREAVDFLRYYATQAKTLGTSQARGLISCISPWNFPLAIFTGQIAAALAAGNGVLAKPADPTPIIATLGVQLLHQAGVPKNVVQLLPGPGSVVGTQLTADPRVKGICFTGSTAVGQTINKAMSANLDPDASFIAETGGLNAMIVDSTALPEQAVKDIVMSSFQSAGQRCSALRLLYLQVDIAKDFIEMLEGAMDQLKIGNPWRLSTDLGPVINAAAQQEIENYIDVAASENRLIKRLKKPAGGFYVSPAVVKVNGIKDLEKEIFGPVLHIATFEAGQIDQIITDINASGYGLTFGLHTRIDDRVEQVTSQLNVGNMYVNRNQIGAIVGSQPFGGEGLSGTGPKAGGPHYVPRFVRHDLVANDVVSGRSVNLKEAQTALDQVQQPVRKAILTQDLPGPTGESNRLTMFPKGIVLCLGPTLEDAMEQARLAQETGCTTLVIAPEANGPGAISGVLEREAITQLQGFEAVALWSNVQDLTQARIALSHREGAILPLLSTREMKQGCVLERHICVDTTAAGGNASLLAEQ